MKYLLDYHGFRLAADPAIGAGRAKDQFAHQKRWEDLALQVII